jgi:hypothetical protein
MALYPPDVLTIDGQVVDMVATNLTIDYLRAFGRGISPELHFTRILRTPGALPDAWNLKRCTLTMQSTLVFNGTVQGYVDRFMDNFGWMREYRAFGLMYSGNYVPVTDSLSFSDTSVWNQAGDDPTLVSSRMGQTVGQIVTYILQMQANATALSALGIGAYVSLTPPTLPPQTLTDLGLLSVIPRWVVRIAGERLLPALESFVQSFHPNHFLYVDVTGMIRFFDPRQFPDYVVTLNDPADPRWNMPQLTRDASDNYSRVVVRGNTLVQAVTLQDKPWANSTAPDGGLEEDFAWGTLTNAQAKAAWVPSDWSQPNTNGMPLEVGRVVAVDTQDVDLYTAGTYATDQLAQGPGELLGWLVLQADSLGGNVQQYWQARITANSATVGGITACQIDATLPSLAYNSYQLFGLAAGPNAVGRRYKVTNPAIASALEQNFPYPVPYIYANGTAAEMTTSPIGTVFYNALGSPTPPFTSSTAGLTIDPVGGVIYFNEPVQVIVGGMLTPPRFPAVVQALLAVGIGALEVSAPATGYAGTLFTVEGVQRTKTITVLEWRDLSNDVNMKIYASEVLDSVKDIVVEGSLPYLGLPALDWLFPGRTVSIHGQDFTTGWETLRLPVVAVEVEFNNSPVGTSYTTTLQLSNRRTPYDAANFLRPNVSTQMFGGGAGVFGAGIAESMAASASFQEQAAAETLKATRPQIGVQGVTPFGPQTAAGFGQAVEQQMAGFGGAAQAQMAAFGGTAATAAGGLGGSVAMAMAAMPTMAQAVGTGGPMGQRVFSPQERQQQQAAAQEQADRQREERRRDDREALERQREMQAEQAQAVPFIPRRD